MKLLKMMTPCALALAVIAVPAGARTTVERVHGPMKVLPHHDKKICTTRWVHHKQVRKCHYR